MALTVTYRGPTSASIAVEGGKRTWDELYVVESSVHLPATQEYATAVITASGLPRLKSSHASAFPGGDARAYLMSKSLSRPNWKVPQWLVACKYETLSREQKKKLEHPFDRPSEISGTSERFQLAIDKDYQSTLVVNTVGDPFDPPLEVDWSARVLTITKNLQTEPIALANTYTNATNSDAFKGAAPKTVKCFTVDYHREIEEFGDEGSEIEVEFWPTTCTFHHNPANWHSKPLNAGWQVIDLNAPPAAANRRRKVKDSRGLESSVPVAINQNGTAEIDPLTLPGAAIFLDFQINDEIPFQVFTDLGF